MVMDRTEIEALAKDCGLYVVEGRGTIGLALEHPLMDIYKDCRYCERNDIVVKFHGAKGKYAFANLATTAEYETIYDTTNHTRKRLVVIGGTAGSIWDSIDCNLYLMPELIIKAIVVNLKLRLDDLMKGGLLSKKKMHMKDIKNCGVEYDV